MKPASRKRVIKKVEVKKIHGSLASYYHQGEPFTDLDELASVLVNWPSLPKTFNDTKACELGLLARDYKRLKGPR
jgi:hypothetical protein